MTETEMLKTEINLILELAEVNMILNALGQLPYAQVSGTITKIMSQGQPQLPKEITDPLVDQDVKVVDEEK